MVAFSQKRMASLTLLSIMLPISLLAGFRIAGIISEPPETQTITMVTVNWTLERPSNDIRFSHDAKNLYHDNTISIEVIFVEYLDNYSWNGLDFFTLMVHINGSLSGITAKFQPVDTESAVDIDEDVLQNSPRLPGAMVNLTLVHVKDGSAADSEAYAEAKAISSPSELTILAHWVFFDVAENSKDHTLKMVFEVTCLNGATQRRIIAPANLELTPVMIAW